MSESIDKSAPKRVRKAESPEVSGNQGGDQVAHALQVDWAKLPDALIPKIGVHLNKQAVMCLRCVNKSFRKELDASQDIKRPLKEIRADFKQDVRELKSGDEIPAYMYDDVQELTGHSDCVTSVTQLADGRIVSGSWDKTLRVWDLDKQEYDDGFVRVLTGHSNEVYSVTQLTDSRIVSGSEDTTLRVWDLDKQEHEDGYVRVLTGHTRYVTSVTQLSDGKIVSASGDNTLRVWGYVNPETGEAS